MLIHIHHINGNHEDNKKGNTIEICVRCHNFIHKGISQRKHRGSTSDRGYGLRMLTRNRIKKEKLFELTNRIENYRKIWLQNKGGYEKN